MVELSDAPPASAPAALGDTAASTDTTSAATGLGPPRLVLTRMVLENFKSYHGRQEIGPFHHSFSAVVGPNGSGKSNVIDALLFVFGFRARDLRHESASALIYNADPSANIAHCTVEVHFREIRDRISQQDDIPSTYSGQQQQQQQQQQENEIVEVPGSELVIARRAFKERGRGSQYFINGRASSHADVRDLLIGKGVDLTQKRFMILQGEVESISQMTPSALLDYLEDIIGTNKYKDDIVKLAGELDKFTDDRAGALTLLNAIAKEKNALEDKRNEALKYVDMENELVTKLSVQAQVGLRDLKVKYDKAHRVYEDAKAELQKAVEAGEEDDMALKEREKELNEFKSQHSKLAKEADMVTAQLATFEREELSLKKRFDHHHGQCDRKKNAIEKARDKKREAELNIQTCDQSNVHEGKQRAKLVEQLADEERKLASVGEEVRGKTMGLAQQLEKKQQAMAPWTAKIAAVEGELRVVEAERGIIVEKTEAAGKLVEQANVELEQICAAREACIARQQTTDEEFTNVTKTAQGLEKQVHDAIAVEKTAQSNLATARAALEDGRDQLRQSESRSGVLKALLRERDLGRIPGIIGRLGDLGTIDSKYDVAISTACPQLEHILVENVPAAEQCLDFLRNNNIGRATCIALDKLGSVRSPSAAVPRGAEILHEKINAREERLEKAFFSVLGHTLVVKDLKTAKAVAYGETRWRVVTLSGELIESSGTLSGGGNKVIQGRMGSQRKNDATVTEKDIADLERKWQAAEAAFNDARAARMRLEADMHHCVSTILPTLKQTAAKLRLEVTALDAQVADAQQRLEQAQTEQQQKDGSSKSGRGGRRGKGGSSSSEDSAANRLAEIDHTISEHNSQIEQIREQSQHLQSDIDELQSRIDQAGGIKVRIQRERVTSVKDQIASLDTANAERMKTRAISQQTVLRFDKQIESLRAEMAEIETTAESLQADLEKVQERIYGMRDSSAKARVKADKIEEGFVKIKQEVTELRDASNQRKSAELTIVHKRDEAERKMAEVTKMMNFWQAQLRQQRYQCTTANQTDADLVPPKLSDEELDEVDSGVLNDEVERLKVRVASSKRPNLSVIKDYIAVEHRWQTRKSEYDSVSTKRESVYNEHEKLCTQRRTEFMDGFVRISAKLKEMYLVLTLGGNAELELVDTLDPFAGVVFSVQPPRKSWKNIANLSGGEKTLSSLALVFALHHFRPTPLYVMDEIDAALDFRNVSIVGEYVRTQTKQAQFLIISLRNDMFERADRLVGIYKTQNKTKSVCIDTHAVKSMSAMTL
ncbi:RecF/RecN/SMC protein [Ramicandelaber brevisporus]|nr:RecF/RecN/SMC protein [Ramicandelaber brevisporus]